MQRNALRLYMLVNDVLDFSKLEVNKFVVHEEVIDLNELVHYLVMDAQDLAKERKIDLSFSKCSNLPALWLDRKMIEKILMNLVSNALKFTPEEGGVSVVLEKHEDRVFIKVKDTGIGVAQADIPRLFERFHQINSSSTRAHVGTGIGLAITKQFTELLNGTILVNSELGKGTEFIVDLPIREASSEPKILGTPSEISQISHTDVVKPLDTSMSLLATKQKKLEPKVTGDKPLILIVDDNEDMQLYMISLSEELYDIRLAKDGKSALEAIYKHHPQAVISDVMMPIMDGYQLTEAIKTDPDIQHIPIILVTAKSGGGSIKSSLETGADDYLSKPFMAEELIARTKAAVRSYENHEKLKALNTQISQQANLASFGQLSAGIAHEINNPITLIDNNVKVLKKYISNVKHVLEGYKQCLAQTHNEALSQEVKQLEENEKIDFILADIDDLMNESIEGTKRVSDIVRGLKTFSRVDAGIQNGVNLNECIESTLKLMQHEFKYNCVLTKELSDLPTIQCAESQLKQVIMNLLMNALQAIKKEGTITISTHTVNDQVVMKIKDTGCGITPRAGDQSELLAAWSGTFIQLVWKEADGVMTIRISVTATYLNPARRIAPATATPTTMGCMETGECMIALRAPLGFVRLDSGSNLTDPNPVTNAAFREIAAVGGRSGQYMIIYRDAATSGWRVQRYNLVGNQPLDATPRQLPPLSDGKPQIAGCDGAGCLIVNPGVGRGFDFRPTEVRTFADDLAAKDAAQRAADFMLQKLSPSLKK